MRRCGERVTRHHDRPVRSPTRPARELTDVYAQAALDPRLHAPVTHYLTALARWNRVHNLTRVDDPIAAYHRHVDESLSLVPFIEDAPEPAFTPTSGEASPTDDAATPSAAGAAGLSGRAQPGVVSGDARAADDRWLVDIGSGAGVPGLLLAIAAEFTGRPRLLGVTLVEPAQKRVAFLRTMIAELGLSRVEVCADRIERLADSAEHRARYAVATSRAFADPRRWLAVAAPLVVERGRALVMLADPPEDWGPTPTDDATDPRWPDWQLTEISPQPLSRALTLDADAGPPTRGPARHVAVFRRRAAPDARRSPA